LKFFLNEIKVENEDVLLQVKQKFSFDDKFYDQQWSLGVLKAKVIEIDKLYSEGYMSHKIKFNSVRVAHRTTRGAFVLCKQLFRRINYNLLLKCSIL
jgi:hypothetical protein